MASNAMAFRTYTVYDGMGVSTFYYVNSWFRSPRKAGSRELNLQPQSHFFIRRTCARTTTAGFAFPVPFDAEQSCVPSLDSTLPPWSDVHNVALARFTGKVKKNRASLGVTVASYKQSRDMIVDRTNKLLTPFKKAEQRVRKMTPRQRRRAAVEDRASDILEGMFGWAPLIQDVQQSLKTLAQPIPEGWISGRHKAAYQLKQQQIGTAAYNYTDLTSGWLSETINAKVKSVNPNLWLLNQLGLLNLPGVAWDLVPWSFVVNMFTNAAQMINSVTDFVGVDFEGINVTRSSQLERQRFHWPNPPPIGFPTKGNARATILEVERYRWLTGEVPPPTFQLRVPEMNLGLAVIGWALISQRIGRINSLLGLTNR